MMCPREENFNVLVGKVFTKIEKSNDDSEIKFYCTDGTIYLMFHDQDCCESVYVEDIIGNLDSLVGWPILMAEEATSYELQPSQDTEWTESFTWTFYKLATIKGYVTIRWLGESNGFYSEDVSLIKLEN